jgi:parvulin-like peptidyl-prolyl isomerase
MSDARPAAAHAQRWLIVGALAGAAIAAATLARSGAPDGAAADAVPAEAVALVNGQAISRDQLARFVAAIAQERGRVDLDAAEQRRILDRLIDEELLLQHGIALGLDRSEPSARRAIVSAVVDTLTTNSMREPTRDELEAFYVEHSRDFSRPGPIQVEVALVPVPAIPEAEAKQRAAEIARRARAGESFKALVSELAAPLDPPLPAGPTPIDALRDRVGGIVVQALARLAPGETSDPVRAMDGWWVARLVSRDPDVSPPLDAVAEAVRQAWIQSDHDARLQEEIATLRESARIEIADPAN